MAYGKTNREKRAQLDRDFVRGYRNYDEAEIVQSREAYLKKHYGTFLHRNLPLPESRQLPNRRGTLTMKLLEEQIRTQHNPVSRFLGMGFGALFCLFMGILISWAGFSGDSFLCIVIGLVFLGFGGLTIHSVPDAIRRDKEAISLVENGKIEIRGYRVLDMSHQDESSASDDNADWHYYLHLEKPGQAELWYYDCGKEAYDTIREGDIVYMVFCVGQDSPFFLFQEEYWAPDPQIQAYMRNAHPYPDR